MRGWAARVGIVLCLLAARPAGPARADELPEVAAGLLAEAQRLAERGSAAAATAKYEALLHLEPTYEPAYVAVAALAQGAGDPARARAVLLRGLAVAPTSRDLLYNLAALEVPAGESKNALAHVEMALHDHPRDAALHALRGSALRALERYGDALAAFQTAAELAPDDARIRFSLGNQLYQLGRREEAATAFRQTVDSDAKMVRAWYNLGAVLYELHRDDEALAAYEVALAPLDTDLADGETVPAVHAKAYSNLGAILLRRQSWDAALEAYQKAARIDPKLPVAPYHQGYVHFHQARYDQALAAYAKARALDPSLPLAYLHPGLIAFRRSQWPVAVDWLGQAVAHLEPSQRPMALLPLARALVATGDLTAAEQRFRELLQTTPDELGGLLGLARLLRQGGRLDEAARLLDHARQLSPNDTTTALEAAALARAANDTESERMLYEAILRQAGDRPAAWPVRLNLALLLLRQGQNAAAEREVATLLARFPSGRPTAGDARENVPTGAEIAGLLRTAEATLLAQRGDLAGAAKVYQGVVGSGSNASAGVGSSRATAMAGLGLLTALRGELPAAAERLAAAADLADDGVEVLLRGDRAQVLWLDGRAAEAAADLSAAAAAFPDWLGAHLARAEIALAGGTHTGPDLAIAFQHLDAVQALCRANEAGSAPVASPQLVRFAIRGVPAAAGTGRDPLCARAERVRGAALLARALAALTAADRGTRETAEAALAEALRLPLDANSQALAHYLRGTLLLAGGDAAGARGELGQALAGPLDTDAVPMARTNLGLALARIGDVAAAIEELERARLGTAAGTAPPVTASLALGLLIDQRGGDVERAKALYREVLAAEPGQPEARARLARLERIAP